MVAFVRKSCVLRDKLHCQVFMGGYFEGKAVFSGRIEEKFIFLDWFEKKIAFRRKSYF